MVRNLGVTLCVATCLKSGLLSGHLGWLCKVQRFQMEARRSWKSMQCIRSQPAGSALVSRALQLDALVSFTSELEQVSGRIASCKQVARTLSPCTWSCKRSCRTDGQILDPGPSRTSKREVAQGSIFDLLLPVGPKKPRLSRPASGFSWICRKTRHLLAARARHKERRRKDRNPRFGGPRRPDVLIKRSLASC